MTIGTALFETALGTCGVAWSKTGIVRVLLPDANADATRARLAEAFDAASEKKPPKDVKRAIDAMTALLAGDLRDLGDVPLDMSGVPDFHRRVYDVARTIPAGATLSYGEVATRAGSPKATRAVGQALGKNPFAIVVPCHRVLAAGGKVGGFTAHGGTSTKRAMLAVEKAPAPKSNGAASAAFERAKPAAKPALTLFTGEGEPPFDAERALAHLRAADPKLARLIDEVGPFEMKQRQTVSIFGALAESIVYQQLNGRAAATIQARVVALYPKKKPTPEALLRIPDDALRGAGLSQSKLLALRDLAARSVAGEIPTLEQARAMDDEALITTLTKVRGIGRWTVEMLLMFRLGHPDVLPVDDFGVRNGFRIAWNKRSMPKPADLAKHGRKWAPYRTVASWYLWRAVDVDKAKRSNA